jgi:hypothetical protein
MDESEGAIYPPPKDGLPFLVVTFADGSIKAQPTTTRSEARMLLARRTRRSEVPPRVVADDGALAISG